MALVLALALVLLPQSRVMTAVVALVMAAVMEVAAVTATPPATVAAAVLAEPLQRRAISTSDAHVWFHWLCLNLNPGEG